MDDDADLLRRYVEDRSEEAFTRLVERHVNLVYGAALRRVGYDAHLAHDVAQKVFVALARKAARLRGRASLAGWLYVSTQAAAAEVVRGERRRKNREAAAHTMHLLHDDSSAAADWQQLRPLLDDAIVALRADERELIALRFLERRSFAEIGAALRLTDEAARKRLDRALEKLRVALARRGITSTAAAVALALGDFGSGSAPAGLAAKLSTHALAPGAAASAGLATTLAAGLAFSAAFVGAGWAVVQQNRVNEQLSAEVAQLEAGARTVAALRAENQRLARQAHELDELRRLAAELPALRAAARPDLSEAAAHPTQRATVTVEAGGTLRWDAKPVTLGDFVARLRALQETAPDGEAKVGIRGLAEFSALAYAIDEARKADVRHVVVESNAAIDPKMKSALWFGRP